jgi:L-lactate dehydrogenase complex protein LldG
VSGARAGILGRIRANLERDPQTEAAARRTVQDRIAGRRRGTQPARIDLDRAGLLDLFVAKAGAVDATVDRVASPDQVPDAVARYLRGLNLPAEAAIAPNDDLDAMPWAASTLTLERRAAKGSDRVGIARAFAGVAETGTLMMASGPGSPATLNFLPETHVVVLAESEIAGAYEDAWQRLRDTGRGLGPDLPRTVNLITGTSRTGDIEQIIQTGVHGPKRLHILVVRDGT